MNKIRTPYGKIKKSIIKNAKKIKLLICDVDGVLSNGLIYLNENGEEFQTFHVRDGFGIRKLLNNSIEVAIITGRNTKSVKIRCNLLGIKYIYQGVTKKINIFLNLLKKLSLTSNSVAYIGDDLIDWPIMKKVGLSIAVANAHPFLLSKSHYVTKMKGGYGAVREICDLILISKEMSNKKLLSHIN